MIPKLLHKEFEKAKSFYQWDGGALQSISPPEMGFGALYFAHAIPPFRPNHTCILGYGSGCVAELMRKIWGQCKITGIDKQAQDYKFNEYKIKIMDARDFVWDCTEGMFKTRFDYVCIDLWEGGKVPDFIFDVEFVCRLREMTKKMISMNIRSADVPRTKAFYDYGFEWNRVVPVEGNSVLWWSVIGKDIGEEAFAA